MVGRIVEIAEDGRHLSLRRGFLVVGTGHEEIGRVALDSIGAVIVNAHGTTWSNALMIALTRRGVPVVLCGPQHRPEAVLWPVDGHHVQAHRMRCQAEARLPLRKRLWQQLVQAKIRMQGSVVGALGGPEAAFARLARTVRSGDPDNVEAQAARRYWPLVMGPDFRRDPEAPGANALLNYGYTVLRAATARSVMGAGLHPTLGLHHHNRGNPMCLVDDVMEPFRPFVDLTVRTLVRDGLEDLTPPVKQALVAVTTLDLPGPKGTSPLATALDALTHSLATSFEAGSAALDLPTTPTALDLVGCERAQ
ncbi:type II CRISPR-associated endonuclease Cas1 [Roseospira goensis]|uniref:CRISPR-associated endonuclease Cas1 n=1 Tax=Roseospira goensis TaxID=391922 RepID=A0A7W6RX37_9PROT|nr:type II CRISPR-associated endonuclease Cas1 [Roseospira goensis]MBB4284320.1 CRISPR-associated protein Cas1 [Roseospira goensis]